jgi:hypothetical protein
MRLERIREEEKARNNVKLAVDGFQPEMQLH